MYPLPLHDLIPSTCADVFVDANQPVIDEQPPKRQQPAVSSVQQLNQQSEDENDDVDEETNDTNMNGVTSPPNGAHSRNSSIRANARVEITEQPASKALRFRYECEGRSAGSIPGTSSTTDTKTFPSIRVAGYKGRAVVVVSCVTKDPPYRPHPHNLVGKEGCKKGVCTVEINNESMSVSFSNLGIQCVKKRDIEEALRCREEIRVDPFRTGFTHRSQPSSIDLNAVRLCFQVFLESENRGRFTVPLAPVVSEPIFDKKAMSDLVICKLSDASCSVAGGKDLILLCEKVAKEDISVRFYEEAEGAVVWEGFGEFQHANVHKQVAISFRTPRYRTVDMDRSVKCYVQLKRPSDGVTSESLPFEYYPLDSDYAEGKRKRARVEPESHLYRQLTGQEMPTVRNHAINTFDRSPNLLDLPNNYIKTEPMECMSPQQQQRLHGNTPSPHPQPLAHSPSMLSPQPPPANSPYYYQQYQQQPQQAQQQQHHLHPSMGAPGIGMSSPSHLYAPLTVHDTFQEPMAMKPLNIQPLNNLMDGAGGGMEYTNIPNNFQAEHKPSNLPSIQHQQLQQQHHQQQQQHNAPAAVTPNADSEALNLSGLLRDCLDNPMPFSGDLGLSLSFLEGTAVGNGNNQAGSNQPAQASVLLPPPQPLQPLQSSVAGGGDGGGVDDLVPENMTDSFNRFTLHQ